MGYKKEREKSAWQRGIDAKTKRYIHTVKEIKRNKQKEGRALKENKEYTHIYNMKRDREIERWRDREKWRKEQENTHSRTHIYTERERV